jgi:hypothetical protein
MFSRENTAGQASSGTHICTWIANQRLFQQAPLGLRLNDKTDVALKNYADRHGIASM